MLCGKDIGPLRLLRDNEFCTNRHRQLYRVRLKKALNQAGVMVDLQAIGVADFFTTIAPAGNPAESLGHACADLAPMQWSNIHGPAPLRLCLTIDAIAGSRPKALPPNAADREFRLVLDPLAPSTWRTAPLCLPATLALNPVKEAPTAAQVPAHADLAALDYCTGLSGGFPALSLAECIVPACADLSPIEFAAGYAAATPSLPLVIDTDPGSAPMALPLQAADRQFQPVLHPLVAVSAVQATGVSLPATLALNPVDEAQKALPKADFVAPDYRTGIAGVFTAVSPTENIVHAYADLAPMAFAGSHAAAAPGLSLAIDTDPGFAPMALPFGAADRQFQPVLDQLVPAGAVCAFCLPATLALDPVEEAQQVLPEADFVTVDSGAGLAFPAISPVESIVPASADLAPMEFAASSANAASAAALGLPPMLALDPVEEALATAQVSPEGDFVAPEYYTGVADLFAAIPPAEYIVHASADLAPVEFAASLAPAAPRLPLVIDTDPGLAPMALPLQAADRQFQPVPDQLVLADAVPAAALCLPATLALNPVEEAPLAAQAPASDFVELEYQTGVADLFTAISPAENIVPACADLAPMEFAAGHALAAPGLPLVIDTDPGSAPMALPFQAADRVCQPVLEALVPVSAVQATALSLPATLALSPVEEAPTADQVPAEAGFFALEYYCERPSAAPILTLEWTWRSPVCALPKLEMQVAEDKLEDLPAKKETLLFFPAAKPKALRNRVPARMMQLAAAGVLLASLIGYGARFATRIGTETPDVKRDAVAAVAPATKVGGPLERVRHAISNRAAVEVSDAFKHGMEAWGQAGSWAPGWTRHAEGYVQPGQLAFFQPSMKFSDYRLEFFGQIESKSMGWAVRAQDPKNYYAMKFTVIQGGLRPIIAMVHYPVTDGHPGKPIETPLMEVMVHANTAYHVAVAVKGNHIVTSIEGQEVDRWVEDRIPNGGVGFYSEAGAKSRLYWMKVSKNEDFLGKVCAYLSGSTDNSRAFAMLLPPGLNYGKRTITTNYFGN